MARKAGQIIARGQSTWLVRVYLGRPPKGYAQMPQSDHSWSFPSGAAVPQFQTAAAR